MEISSHDVEPGDQDDDHKASDHHSIVTFGALDLLQLQPGGTRHVPKQADQPECE